MEDKPAFSLPTLSPPPAPRSHPWIAVLATVFLVSGANLACFWLWRQTPASAPATAPGPLSGEEAKDVALRLESRNLFRAARTAWEGYLTATPSLSPGERGLAYFNLGELSRKAGDFEEAVRCYYQAEKLLPPDKTDLRTTLNEQVLSCLESLGKHQELSFELEERSAVAPKKADDPVVAEWGRTKWHLSDLLEKAGEELDLRMAMMGGELPPETAASLKKQELARLDDPQERLKKLQQLATAEALYRKARERGLERQPELKKKLAALTRATLTESVLAGEFRDRIKVSDGDLKNYYDGRRQEFEEPEKYRVAHLAAADEAAARSLLATLKTEEDWKKAAAAGGEIPGEHAAGSPLPDLAQPGDLYGELKALAPGKWLDKPWKGDKQWHLYRLLALVPARTRTYEEAKQEVRYRYENEKQQEVYESLMGELFKKYDVKLHPEAFSSPETKKPAQDQGDQAK